MAVDWKTESQRFDGVADLYDAYRPTYPSELVDTILAHTLILSAQAWHWVPNNVGYAKAAAALKPSGSLALFWNMYPDPRGPIFDELNQVYRQRAPSMNGKKIAHEELARQRESEIARSGYFKNIRVFKFPWFQRYDVTQYLGLLHTYSDHLALPADTFQSLCDGIAGVIRSHGGWIDKPYLAVLYLAQRA